MVFRKKIMGIAIASVFGLALSPQAFSEDVKNQPAANKQSAQTEGYWGIRGSTLIGREVVNSNGDVLGNISDFIVDVNNGWAHYAILSRGGFAGIGNKLFAYPIAAFQPASGDRLSLNVAESALEKSTGFDQNKWPNWNDANYRKYIDQHYPGAKPVQQNAKLVRGSDLLDQDINALNGNEIGELEDVVINLKNGQIHYAVAELDTWGFGDKLFAIPLRAFSQSAKGDDLVLNVTKDRIDANRGFDKNNWPDINDPTFVRDVDVYFVTVVPVTDTGTAGPAGQTGASGQNAADRSLGEAGIENPKAAAERGPKDYDSVRKEHVERTKGAATEQGAAGPSGDPIAPKLRDWSKIDKNDDGLIQPEEMNAWNEKYTGRQVPK